MTANLVQSITGPNHSKKTGKDLSFSDKKERPWTTVLPGLVTKPVQSRSGSGP